MTGLVCTRSPGVACLPRITGLAQDRRARLPRITGLAPTNYSNMSSSSEDDTVEPELVLMEQNWPDLSNVEGEKQCQRLLALRLEWHREFLATVILLLAEEVQESGRNASEQHGNDPNPNGGTTSGTKKRNRSGGFKRSRRIRLLRIQCEHPDALPSDEALLAKARKTRSKATRNATSLRSTLRKGVA